MIPAQLAPLTAAGMALLHAQEPVPGLLWSDLSCSQLLENLGENLPSVQSQDKTTLPFSFPWMEQVTSHTALARVQTSGEAC